MQAIDIEQKIIAYLTLPKNKVSPWGRVCNEVGIPEAQAKEILNDLCERNILETQTISLGRIVVSLTDNFSSKESSKTIINRGFSGNTIGNNFSGNTIIIGDGKSNQSTDNSINLNVNNPTSERNGKSSFWKFIVKFWWKIIIPIFIIIVGLILEHYFF